jgi:hypothetical protein
VGSDGVSGDVSTTYEVTTVNADLVSSGPIGVDCSTVATALEEALGEWKREGRVRDLRLSLLDLLRSLEVDEE